MAAGMLLSAREQSGCRQMWMLIAAAAMLLLISHGCKSACNHRFARHVVRITPILVQLITKQLQPERLQINLLGSLPRSDDFFSFFRLAVSLVHMSWKESFAFESAAFLCFMGLSVSTKAFCGNFVVDALRLIELLLNFQTERNCISPEGQRCSTCDSTDHLHASLPSQCF